MGTGILGSTSQIVLRDFDCFRKIAEKKCLQSCGSQRGYSKFSLIYSRFASYGIDIGARSISILRWLAVLRSKLVLY